jgi:exonuclease III
MDDQGVSICAVTHTNLPTCNLQRWKTGHVLFNSGAAEARTSASRRRPALGVGFVVSKAVSSSPIFASSAEMISLSGRTAALRFRFGRSSFFAVVHYAPTSRHLASVRQHALEEVDDILAMRKDTEILVMGGDWNASIGDHSAADDNVCGNHGNPRLNPAGLQLRGLLARHELYAPATHTRNTFEGTWTHPASHTQHQIDHFFLHRTTAKSVRKCINAVQLVNSDHLSV